MDSVRDYQYERLQDDDLLRLASDSQDLEADAQKQLNAELTRRGIGSKQQKQFESEIHFSQLQPQLKSYRGSGSRFFGREFVRTEPNGAEVVRTMKFLTLFWVPLIPMGCYTIRLQDPKQSLWDHGSLTFTALEKNANDWGMVLRIWLSIIAAMGLLFLALEVLERFILR